MNQKNNNTSSQDKERRVNLGKKTVQGMVWSLAGQVLNKGTTMLTLMILARLLTRADFGLIATATIVIDLLSPYRDLGLGQALIQNRDNFKSAANSVFTVNLLAGVVLSLAVCLSAPLVAAFFNSEMVIPLLRWLSLIFVINSIGSVHITILKKELDYRKKLVPDIGGALLKAVITISLAFNGFGVWSIIWGQLTGLIVSVILSWLVVSWRPQLKIDYGLTRRFLRYGASIMGINTISVMTNNISYIIVGKVCGMALLGVFSLSFRLPEVLLIGNLWVLSEVFFSMFSMIQKDAKKIREGFLASIRLVSLFATPISLGLILTAEPLILVVYGEQWLEAVPVLRVLAVYAWVHSLGYHAGDVYKAVGRPVVLLYLTIGAAIIDLTSIIIGSQFGLLGIATGLLAGMILNCAINLFVVFKMVGVTPGAIIGELKSSMCGCFVLMSCIWLVIIFSPETSSPILQLVMMILSGGAGYLLIIWLMEKANILLIFKKLGLAKKMPGNYR